MKGRTGETLDEKRTRLGKAFNPANQLSLDEIHEVLTELDVLDYAKVIDGIAGHIASWFPVKTGAAAPSADKLRGPTDRELDALDDAVTKLARAISKRAPRRGWDSYKRVSRRFPKWKLSERVERLMTRATLQIPPRPMAVFQQIEAGGGEVGELAAKFNRVFPKLRRAEVDVNAVDWLEFSPLFLRYRNLSRDPKHPMPTLESQLTGKSSGAPHLLPYTVCLEIDAEDRRWLDRFSRQTMPFWEWLVSLGHQPFVDKFLGILMVFPVETPDEMKRERVRARVARHREKVATKSVT
jgi:hypothetical protein